MSDSILKYEERMWELFKVSQAEMPDLNEAYSRHVKEVAFGEGVLAQKTKRLIALAVAVQAGCRDGMVSQTSKALDAGATVPEIFEACQVAIGMGGSLAWSKSLIVAEYLLERGLISSDNED
ncbi:carboxymuconolactone decarboxylase family protein [Maridesulfovibrio sp. FT414]|uniref:carboxymuconolactone decarboxylase family protein n=1 Tax=Maridesulfovibrio sp. FT414 TaxID=2979469 RepID=UPI003D8038B6